MKQQLVSLILLHGCIDIVTFMMHRVSHRVTNAMAVQLLPAVSAGSVRSACMMCMCVVMMSG